MATIRIPHVEHEVIRGKKKTIDYLRMQKIMGRFYFNDFFTKFDQIGNHGRFLEVGPGPGYQTAMVYDKYSPEEIIGLEYSEDMISVAENYLLEKGISGRIKYICGAVEDEDKVASLGKFDIIYSTFSLHHWTDPSAGIRNLYNALSDNGTIFIYDFIRGGPLYYLPVRKGINESVRASYKTDEIADFMKDLGIEDYLIRQKGLYLDLVVIKKWDMFSEVLY
jgi:SAM-dependent methyltransferase